VIEARFPTIRTAEPAVLAHHLTAAGLTEAAIPLWQTAGDLALERWALTEATAHFNQGLKLVTTLAASPERDAIELGLRSRRETAWLAHTSRAASERWTKSPQPGRAFARSVDHQRVVLPILWGLTIRRPAPGIYCRPGTASRRPTIGCTEE
jgi:predicted ATPase